MRINTLSRPRSVPEDAGDAKNRIGQDAVISSINYWVDKACRYAATV